MSEAMPAARSQGLAITGFVLAIVGFFTCGLLGIAGAIVSGIAMAKASSEPHRYAGKGLAIAGLVIGIVSVLFSMLLLPAIMLPALGKARVTAQQLKSSSQLRGITQALVLYAQNNRDELPPADADWVAILVNQGFVPAEMFVSPAAQDTSVISYFYVPVDGLRYVSDRVLVYEMPGLFRDGVNIAFHDNHVEFVPTAQAQQIISSLTLPDGTPWQPHLNPRPAP